MKKETEKSILNKIKEFKKYLKLYLEKNDSDMIYNINCEIKKLKEQLKDIKNMKKIKKKPNNMKYFCDCPVQVDSKGKTIPFGLGLSDPDHKGYFNRELFRWEYVCFKKALVKIVPFKILNEE